MRLTLLIPGTGVLALASTLASATTSATATIGAFCRERIKLDFSTAAPGMWHNQGMATGCHEQLSWHYK